MMKASSLLFLLSMVIGQQQLLHSLVGAITYLHAPVLVWNTQTDVILDGNGVYISPDDSITVVSQASGNLNAYDTRTGQSLWQFLPPTNNDLPLTCQGGVTFSTEGNRDYLIYSVVDDPNGIVSYTRVISLGFDGSLNWVSTPLEGAAAGSPLASFDGRYVFLTHNSNAMSVGHFSVLDTFEASFLNPVFPLYSEFNVTNPFSPPGVFHKPAEGFYDGGQLNTNDIVVWAHSPNPLEARVGDGMTFVFQLPLDWAASNQQAVARQADQGDGIPDFTEEDESEMNRRLFWIILGDSAKDWQAVSAPVLTNQGRSLYWSVSRSQFRAWVGQAGTNFARFNRGRTNSPGFGRGSPRYAACPNTPALSSSTTEPMIFAGTAAEEFVKMNYLMDEDSALVRNTTSRVRARAIVSPDDKFVYFSEFVGIVHQARTDDLVDNWSVSETGQLDGEFALTSDGTMLIVGDVTGNVFAYQVAELPTPAPTPSPTKSPTAAPRPQPTTGFRPTFAAPIPIPGLPTVKPTRSPIFQTMPTLPETPPTLPMPEEEEEEKNSQAAQTRTAFALFALVGAFLLMM